MIEYYHYDMGSSWGSFCCDYVVDMNHIIRWAYPRRFCLVVKVYSGKREGTREFMYSDSLPDVYNMYLRYLYSLRRKKKHYPYHAYVMMNVGSRFYELCSTEQLESSYSGSAKLEIEPDEIHKYEDDIKSMPKVIAEDRSLVIGGVKPRTTP